MRTIEKCEGERDKGHEYSEREPLPRERAVYMLSMSAHRSTLPQFV